MSTTEDVLEHHLEVFAARDVEATMSDYADDATVITHDGMYHGTAEIRELFETLYDEFETAVEFNFKDRLLMTTAHISFGMLKLTKTSMSMQQTHS